MRIIQPVLITVAPDKWEEITQLINNEDEFRRYVSEKVDYAASTASKEWKIFSDNPVVSTVHTSILPFRISLKLPDEIKTRLDEKRKGTHDAFKTYFEEDCRSCGFSLDVFSESDKAVLLNMLNRFSALFSIRFMEAENNKEMPSFVRKGSSLNQIFEEMDDMSGLMSGIDKVDEIISFVEILRVDSDVVEIIEDFKDRYSIDVVAFAFSQVFKLSFTGDAFLLFNFDDGTKDEKYADALTLLSHTASVISYDTESSLDVFNFYNRVIRSFGNIEVMKENIGNTDEAREIVSEILKMSPSELEEASNKAKLELMKKYPQVYEEIFSTVDEMVSCESASDIERVLEKLKESLRSNGNGEIADSIQIVYADEDVPAPFKEIMRKLSEESENEDPTESTPKYLN